MTDPAALTLAEALADPIMLRAWIGDRLAAARQWHRAHPWPTVADIEELYAEEASPGPRALAVEGFVLARMFGLAIAMPRLRDLEVN